MPWGTKPVRAAVSGSIAQAPPSEPMGTRDIDSTPPASTRSSKPERTFCAARLTASRPLAQNRLICTPATVSGSPAASAAVLAMTEPCSPMGETTPRTTSSTSAGSRSGLRRRTSSMRPVVRLIGLTECSPPVFLPLPRGVRTASYTNASAVMVSFREHGCAAEMTISADGSEAERPADDLLHDLGRAAVDGLDAGVQEGPRDGVLEHVAVAAVQLQAAVDDLLLQLGGPPLGHGGVLGGEPPGVVLQDRLLQVGLGDRHLGVHLGELEAGVLEPADRPAERRPLLAVLHGAVEDQPARGHGDRGDGQPLLGQVVHQVEEAVALGAQQIARRHANVVEEELGGVLRLEADLVQVPAALEA